MRKKLGLSIVALTAVTAFAFAGTACAKKSDNSDNDNGTYTVTFDANGGMFSGGGSTATKTVDKGGYVSGEEKPTRDKFVFYGWLKDENDIVTVNLSTTAIDGNTTFYAGWKQAVDITFYYNYADAPNGGVYMTDTIASGSTVTEPTDPSRTGWTLDCWTTDAAGDNIWTFASDKAMNSVDLYAQWLESGNEQTTHTVTLDIDGVTSTHSVNDGSKFSRPDNDPVKDGWDFIEWRLGSLSGAAYNFDTPVTSDISLYAYFVEEGHEEQTYKVTLHIGDETTEHTVKENNKFAKPDDPELDGYSFIEWRLGSLDGAPYNFNTLVTGDIDLYAYFVDENAVMHSIAYVLDDGESTVAINASGNPSSFAEGKAVTLKNPSRLCYTFEGWYTDAELENKVTEIAATETDDVTLYAKWSYNYPFFVTGYDNNWTEYGKLKDKPDDDTTKQSLALYPFIVGEGENRTWDNKTYVANRVYLTQGVGNVGHKIINATNWYGAGGSSDNTAENLRATAGTGYYTVKIVANGDNPTNITITETLRKVTVSFDLGDSNITLDAIEYKDGGKVTEPEIEGCTVSAWYKDEAKTNVWDFDEDTVTEDTTLYAGEITADEYTVTYTSYNNLTWNAAVTKVSFGGSLDLSYTLGDAYSNSLLQVKVNGTVVEGDTYAVTTAGNITITISGSIAKNKYTVTFYEADGTTKISEVTAEHGSAVTAPTPETITGKQHTGWSGALTNITGDTALTAVYEFIDYTVTFNSNGGTDVDDQTLHYGDTITEPNNITKPDMILTGWYTEPDFADGTKWDFENGTMPADDVELFAKWEKDLNSVQWFTISYKRNKDDATAYNTVEVSENGTVSKPTIPKLTGYVFDKWFDTATDAEYTFGAKPTADVTLYATWTLKAPTVTVNNVSGEYKPDGYTLTATPAHELDGVTYSYQWFKSGNVIANATSATYIVSSVADSGEYSVEVTAIKGELTASATATATVDIQKATLPEIMSVAFKDGDAYNCAITFNADSTTAATYYILNIYDSDNAVVFTTQIANDGTEATKEIAVTAALKGEHTVKITYGGIANANDIQNTEAQATLTFKGAGTEECPFDVATVADLKLIAGHSTAHFIQTADITADKNSGLTALFTSDATFMGVYDGNGYTVGGITDGRGLFGYIGESGTVKNLTLSVKLSSSAIDYMGGVAAVNNGRVIGVTVKGSIASSIGTVNTDGQKATYGVGGIVGKNREGAVISGCTNEATVRGNISVGGLVGYNMTGATVTDSVNSGAIGTVSTTMSWAGGLVGLNGGAITRSVNNADVQAQIGASGDGNGNNYVSGLVAENSISGIISECVNNGKVQCDYAPAGLVSKNAGAVEYCINSGNVNSRYTASGGTCLDNGSLIKCIMTGTVSASGGGDVTAVNKSGTATDCYYKNGTNSGSKKYDVSTTEKAIAILGALGDKFVYDGTDIVLAYDKTACVVTFKVNDEIYLALNVASGVEIDLTKITAPTAPENYTFGGWTGADGDTVTISGDIELTAQFNKNQYTITFVTDGSAVDSITDEYDKPLTAPTSDKTGYTLSGWYEDGSEIPFDFTAERSGNVTLTAKWTANTYKVTFNANGGNVSSTDKTVTFDGKYGEMPTPTKSGYKFVGWFSQLGNDDGSGWGVQITAATDYKIADGVTVYAKWEQVSNKVVLNYNYDGSPEAHEIGVAGDDTQITINVISRVGYTLLGFATEANSEVEYTTTLTKTQFDELVDSNGAVALYAVWGINTYTITVNLDGGEWNIETLTFTIEDLDADGYYDLSALIPTRDCRTFEGWTITRNGANVEHIELSDDYTITANWSDPSHTEQTVAAKDATCTETGLTEGKICSICGEVLAAQEVVPTIDHNYEDGECTVCGQKELTLNFTEKVDGTYEVAGIIGEINAECIEIPSEYKGVAVTSIAANAFNDSSVDYSGIKSVIVPNSVTSIGSSAFGGCKNIESITIPFVGANGDGSGSVYIGWIFVGATGAANNKDIPTSLNTVIITGGTSIGNSAFRYCTNLKNVVIPKSLNKIDSRGFQLGTVLDNVYYEGTETEWNSISINSSNNSDLTNATRYYYSETRPTESGNYWHYVDGVPTVWEL